VRAAMLRAADSRALANGGYRLRNSPLDMKRANRGLGWTAEIADPGSG
jgi:hypothetical protein